MTRRRGVSDSTGRERVDSAGRAKSATKAPQLLKTRRAAFETDDGCSGDSRMDKTRRTGTGGGEAATGIRNACCCFPFGAGAVRFVGQNLDVVEGSLG